MADQFGEFWTLAGTVAPLAALATIVVINRYHVTGLPKKVRNTPEAASLDQQALSRARSSVTGCRWLHGQDSA
jgi:hypothetical protein